MATFRLNGTEVHALDSHPHLLAALREELRHKLGTWLRSGRSRSPAPSDADRERLRDLGYVE